MTRSAGGAPAMPEVADSAFDAVLAHGREAATSEPRARAARYDRSSRRVVVELAHGCTFAFPADLVRDLGQASDNELAAVEILGAGYGLHWESLDVDLAVLGLLAGRFGSRA